MSIDFAGLAARLLASADTIVPAWLPSGKRQGDRWVVGGLNGDKGSSMTVSLSEGFWVDFATGDKGGDLISLYAGIHSMTQKQAAEALGADDMPVRASPTPAARKPAVLEPPAQRPPPDVPEPGPHYRWGPAAHLYRYTDSEGATLFYVARYEPEGERKQFAPWRWLGGKWEAKAYTKPRPLYGLHRLAEAPPERRVMLVEGEKAADALAPVLARSHVVMTWAGGARALDTADWSVLAGRRVDIWPDADLPGREAAADLCGRLHGLGCAPIRIIVPEGQPDGWDAADAISGGWDRKAIAEWIGRDGGKYLVEYKPPAEPEPSVAESPPSAPSSPASASQAPGPSVRDERSLWLALGLEVNVGNGTPPANEDTVDRVLTHPMHAGAFWFDTFLQRAMTSLPPGWTDFTTVGDARPLHDSDHSSLTVYLQRHLRLHKMTGAKARSGLELYVFKHQRNCAQEWLNGLQWDGTKRLETLLPFGFGTEDSEYHRAVGRNFMMGMVARVLVPGCQNDYMPVFEGGQGKRKSTALRTLGGDWFTEATDSILTKDFLQNLHGKMLVEIAELHAFKKAEQDRIKGIITNRVDTYRASYGRTAGDYPRQCVFAGTTNRDDWVTDDTGARRFWRVLCGDIDIEWLQSQRVQLFAEAVARYRAGEQYWTIPEAEAKTLQDDARVGDPWTDTIMRYASARVEVRAEELLSFALEIPMERQDKTQLSRVRSILRLAGWYSTATKGSDRKSVRVWRASRTEIGPAKLDGAADSLGDQWSESSGTDA